MPKSLCDWPTIDRSRAPSVRKTKEIDHINILLIFWPHFENNVMFFREHVIFFLNNLTYLLAKMTQPSASSILTLLRSFEFKTDPSKNSTCVKCLLKRASSSRFGGIQWRKITSTLTSSRSLCKKSLRKYDTDSKVIWPQTFIGWFQVQRAVERLVLEYGMKKDHQDTVWE